MSRILRILSGLHAGAQMELAAGDWHIGSDALCDILLNDIAAQQATLRIRDDGTVILLPPQNTTIDANQAENFLQGESIPAQGIEVPLYTCISLGQVHAAFGDAHTATEKAWQDVVIPQEEQHTLPKNSIEQTESQTEEVQTLTLKEAVVREKVQGSTEQSFVPKDSYPKESKGSRVILRLLLLVLLLALCLGGIWTLSGPTEAEIQKQDIDAILRSQNSLDLAVTQDEEHIWHVTGGVRDNKTQQNLTQSLQGLPFTVRVNVLSLQEIIQDIEARIKAEGALLAVRTIQQGLRISGYIYDESILDTLLAPLQKDLEYIYLQKDISYYAHIERNLQESLSNLGLQNMVHISPGPYAIVLEANALSKEKAAQLQTFVREATDMTRGINPFIKAAPKPQVPQKTAQPSLKAPAVQEIDFCASLRIGGAGAQLYVTYQNKQYARGAHLPNGLQVQEIREKYTTFTRGDRLLYCPR